MAIKIPTPNHDPVPSADINNVVFAGAKIDEFATSTDHYYIDRMGVQRFTAAGLIYYYGVKFQQAIASSGYKVIGRYEDGIQTLNNYNEIIEYGGEFYKLKPGVKPPFTTTGTNEKSWVNDSLSLVGVGDATLRSELFGRYIDWYYPEAFSSLQEAVNASSLAGIPLYLGNKSRNISSTLILPSNLNMIGHGAVIKFTGNSGSIIETANCPDDPESDLSGLSLPDNIQISGVILDGGWSLGGGGPQCGYGAKLICTNLKIDGLTIKNVYGHGFCSNGNGSNPPKYGTNGHVIDNILVNNCGMHGYRIHGPSDAWHMNTAVIDAGQLNTSSNYLYDGMWIHGGLAGCRLIQTHCWSSGTAQRTRHQLWVQDAFDTHITNGHFEGAGTVNIRIGGTGTQLINFKAYNSFGSDAEVILQAASCVLIGQIQGWPEQGGATTGIKVGASQYDTVKGNVVNVTVTNCPTACCDYSLSDGGNNITVSSDDISANIIGVGLNDNIFITSPTKGGQSRVSGFTHRIGANEFVVEGNSTLSATKLTGILSTDYPINPINNDHITFGNNIQLDGNLSPKTANYGLLGTASNPFSGGNVQSALTITSDERLKEQKGAIPDSLLDVWGDLSFCVFKLKSAVELKGGDARYHSGVIAQEVITVFDKANLNWQDYGVVCYEKGDAVAATDDIKDKDGNLITPGNPAIEAYDRYSVRYDELMIIEMAYQRRIIGKLKG